MIYCEIGEHALNGLVVALLGGLEVVVEAGVVELDVGDGRGIFGSLRGRPAHLLAARRGLAVGGVAGREAAELHDVGGEGAGLVGENVRDLAKLFVEVGGLDARGHVVLKVVDVCVPLDELRLPELDDFDGDEERDGHHVREEEQPGEKRGEERLDVAVPRPGFFFDIGPRHVNVRALNLHFVPHRRPGGRHGAHAAHDSKDDHDRARDHFFQVRRLLLRSDGVAHDSGVVARVGDHADDPVGVAQTAASEKQVVAGQRDLCSVDRLDHAFVFVDLVVRHFANHFAFVLQSHFLGIVELFDAFGRTFVFQVRFAVQVFGFHEAEVLWLRRRKHDEVRREELVLLHLHDLPNLQLLPRHFLKDGLTFGEQRLGELSLFTLIHCNAYIHRLS